YRFILIVLSRLTKDNSYNNDTRKNMPDFGVDDLFSAGQRIIRSDGDKLFVRNRNPALEGILRCHYPTVFHNKICCHDPPEKPCHLLDDSTLSHLNTSFFNQYVSNMRWGRVSVVGLGKR